jgi:hypothetical protein
VIIRPGVRLTVDGRSLTGPEAALVAVMVDLGVRGTHDAARLVVPGISKLIDVSTGASLSLALSAPDDPTDVFTGTVTDVIHHPRGAIITALAKTEALSRTYVGKSYVRQSAGDVARDLVAAGGLDAGDIASGPELGVYHVSERRSAWHHLRALATLIGHELTSAADGGVNVRAVRRAGPADRTLRRGAELVAWDLSIEQPALTALTFVPHGAGSEAGADSWQIPLREPDGASGGRVVVAYPIRTRDAAKTVTTEHDRAAERRRRRGRLTATGDASIRAGALVEVRDTTGGDGTWRVVHARHRLDIEGFLSMLDVERAA